LIQSFREWLTISDASSDMTVTGGTQFHEFLVQSKSSYQRDMKGTNILVNTITGYYIPKLS